MKVDASAYTVDFFAVRKNGRGAKLGFSWLSLVLFPTNEYCIQIYGECYQKCMGGGGVTIASKEIDCADRIVHETGIHKAIVDGTKESECFLNIDG